ncbi:glycosyltransferase family 4 protein [Prosthecobacter sp.]|jgi:starch synthase|uniref:glycosyltransferase family 4 protein n=1 Tax=Prosthecobacter sp. TaxID=1965333 RepID=UPI0037C6C6E8
MPILLSHLTGNPNSCAVGEAFAEAGVLASFHTTLVVPSLLRSWLASVGIAKGFLERRVFPKKVRPFLHSHPGLEWLRLACRSAPVLTRNRLVAQWGSLEQVIRHFDAAVGREVSQSRGLSAVYGYMDTAEQTFEAARLRGIQTIYELPTPYWRFTRDIVEQEAFLQPEWAATLPVLDQCCKAMQRRDRELQLADVVIVPSALVRDSLKLAPPFKAKVHVVPYGCPESLPSNLNLPTSPASSSSRLRLLYVGSLNQGKGLAYLAEAMIGLEELATLTVIGSRTADLPCPALDAFLGAHKHLSGLSHNEVLAEMQQNDVLVLPTLYEGLALVLLEAMACGLTVITTPHSGLTGLINDGMEGFIVPIRSAPAIRDRLRLLAGDAGLLQTMRQAALVWSREHSWRLFRKKIRDVIQVH